MAEWFKDFNISEPIKAPSLNDYLISVEIILLQLLSLDFNGGIYVTLKSSYLIYFNIYYDGITIER